MRQITGNDLHDVEERRGLTDVGPAEGGRPPSLPLPLSGPAAADDVGPVPLGQAESAQAAYETVDGVFHTCQGLFVSVVGVAVGCG